MIRLELNVWVKSLESSVVIIVSASVCLSCLISYDSIAQSCTYVKHKQAHQVQGKGEYDYEKWENHSLGCCKSRNITHHLRVTAH